MTTQTDNPTLEQLRFRKLVRALHRHGTGASQAELAMHFGISAELVAKLIDGAPGAHADHSTIERAADMMGIHPDYFRVKDLGEKTHESFMRSAEPEAEPEADPVREPAAEKATTEKTAS